MQRMLLTAVCGLFALLAPFPAAAQEPLESCPVVVENTHLETDCLGPMVVGASDVVINLGGHQVLCEGSGSGIVIVQRSNVHVTNGHVHSCTFGLVVRGSSHEFTNLHVDGNTVGADVFASETTFQANTFSNNEQIGLTVGGRGNLISAGMVFANNNLALALHQGSSTVVSSTFLDNNHGVDLQSGAHAVLSSHFERHSTAIIVSNRVTSSIVQGNTITETFFDGLGSAAISVGTGGHNTIKANQIYDNAVPAIELLGSPGNTIVENHVFRNAGGGVVVRLGSTGNYIAQNTARDNVPFDIEDDNPNCDANVYENNNFATTNQPVCVH